MLFEKAGRGGGPGDDERRSGRRSWAWKNVPACVSAPFSSVTVSERGTVIASCGSARCVLAGDQHRPEDPAPAARLRCVCQAWLEDADEVACQVGELGIVEP
jgi:hypothetical protein